MEEQFEVKLDCPVCLTPFTVFTDEEYVECFQCGFDKFYWDETFDGQKFIDANLKEVNAFKEVKGY